MKVRVHPHAVERLRRGERRRKKSRGPWNTVNALRQSMAERDSDETSRMAACGMIRCTQQSKWKRYAVEEDGWLVLTVIVTFF